MGRINLKIRNVLCTAFCCAAILAGCAPQGEKPAASSFGTVSAAAVDTASPAASGAVDLTDYDALTDTYLHRPFYSGVTAQSWDTPREIDGGALIDFYGVYWTQ